MRDELPGIIMNVDQISPEVERAQRLQELKDVAEWKARRMAAYRNWVTPEAVAERQREYELAAAAALEQGRAMAAEARRQQLEAKLEKSLKPSFNISAPYVKEQPKLNWWRKLVNRIWR